MSVSFARALVCGSIALLTAGIAACSSNNDSSGSPTTGTTSLPVNAQTPPATNGKDVEDWLALGEYKSWHCEAAPHDARSPSPHGTNRICSNDLTSAFSGTGERPVGSAGVKELYDSTGKTITGYAVYLKTEASSAGGATWYWYERVPGTSAPLVLADGFGDSGGSKSICVACHAAAGSDTAHTPSPGGGDQVYTQVK